MATRFTSIDRRKGPRLPSFLLKIFALAAVVLIPWTIFIAQELPKNHLDQRWDVAWAGFDVGLLVSLAATAYFGLRKSGWMIVAAASAGTFLLADAWFDTLTSQNGWESLVSLSSAAFLEIPLAILAFWIAYRAGKYFFKAK